MVVNLPESAGLSHSARPAALRLAEGKHELSIQAHHALAVASLTPLHRDPFDCLLLAQAMTEGLLLTTADE